MGSVVLVSVLKLPRSLGSVVLVSVLEHCTAKSCMWYFGKYVPNFDNLCACLALAPVPQVGHLADDYLSDDDDDDDAATTAPVKLS